MALKLRLCLGFRQWLHTSACYSDVKIKMPSLSPTMNAGTIVKWLKKEGDKINAGDVLCEIQTDKAVVAMEVDDDGTLAKILVGENTPEVTVGTLIALVAEPGEDWRTVQASSKLPAEGGGAVSSTAAKTPSKAPQPQSAKQESPAAISGAPHGNEKMGPAVRLLLQLYGLNAKTVKATGRSNTLLKDDVMRYITEHKLKPNVQRAVSPISPGEAAAKSAVSKGIPQTSGAAFTDLPLSNMRKTIATRLTQSKRNAAHNYATIEMNASEAESLRTRLKKDGINVSLNDVIVKAAAIALRQIPDVNIQRKQDGTLVRQSSIDISVAVATESGLITPIVPSADTIGIQAISAKIRELAERAKSNKLKLEEFQGGSLTVSNLGMFGISEFTAIINPPQCAILAVGCTRPALDLELKVQQRLRVTLCYDNNAITEETALLFLEAFRSLMELPELLLMGETIAHSSTAAISQ